MAMTMEANQPILLGGSGAAATIDYTMLNAMLMQCAATIGHLIERNALQGTGTRTEMKIEERSKLANEGLVVAAVEASFL